MPCVLHQSRHSLGQELNSQLGVSACSTFTEALRASKASEQGVQGNATARGYSGKMGEQRTDVAQKQQGMGTASNWQAAHLSVERCSTSPPNCLLPPPPACGAAAASFSPTAAPSAVVALCVEAVLFWCVRGCAAAALGDPARRPASSEEASTFSALGRSSGLGDISALQAAQTGCVQSTLRRQPAPLHLCRPWHACPPSPHPTPPSPAHHS